MMERKGFRVMCPREGDQVAVGYIEMPSGRCIVTEPQGTEVVYDSIETLFEAYHPRDKNWILSVPEGWEMGHDPLHADAFRGTPAENVVVSTGPRLMVWMRLDWCGNMIGIEGTVLPC